MEYTSTRDEKIRISAARAIVQGISGDSGLFVPCSFPALTQERLENLIGKKYEERVADILSDFLGGFTYEEIYDCAVKAYGTGRFPDENPAPISKLSRNMYMLELWHGPTCAFKDMALQLLPHLLTLSMKKTGGNEHVRILAATSGDTGKAALEGFKDVDGTSIMVFYPSGGVSKVQFMQMATQDGRNVSVCGIKGNFDDTQTGVKAIFADTAIKKKLAERGIALSSANSINWGRLAPQIVYYISAYCDLLESGEISPGEKINICIPTGNFGNILAAYYAKRMGLPVNMLICASNSNNVLSDFINTGVYDRERELFLTASPSMDILVSSNLERLLYALHDSSSEAVFRLMKSLEKDGRYQVSGRVLDALQAEFYGGYCSESETLSAIKYVWDKYSYLCDTHTAVALGVHGKYVEKTGDNTKTIIASTANPYKFAGPILEALTGAKPDTDEFSRLDALNRITGMDIPPQIAGLNGKLVRFESVREVNEMLPAVMEWTGE